MGAVPAELQARLDSGATTLARCWKVTRADGVVLGFTDHDRDLTVEDTRYLASTGVTASALEAATGLSVDNAEATGALSAAGLTEGDILAGRYDGAEVEQFLVDWERPDLWKRIFRGTLGDIEQEGGLFRAELRSLAEGLNRPVGRAFVRVCECTLGDAKCGFDLGAAGYAAEATVAGVTDNRRLRLTGAEGPLAGWFTEGRGAWVSGANAGLPAVVKRDAGGAPVREVELWQRAAATVAVGDRIRLEAGCDKRFATCRDKFANLLNFRGFPHMPGEDWVTAYPREGMSHDGASLVARE